jgi:NAD(P)H dehydrogenase (quinone)
MSRILITGGTGNLGSVIIDHMLNGLQGNEITALVRDETKAEGLKAKGIRIKVGSYQDQLALVAAMEGIEKLLLISASDLNNRFHQHKNVIDAAKKAGVKHIFYTGVAMKDISTSPLKPLLNDHFLTEAYIKSGGFTYTFLQNGLYFEVIPMFTGPNMLETGIFFPAGQGKVAFASRNELAEVIATVLLGVGHENKTYALTGAEAYSFSDIVEEVSLLSGKNVSYTSPESTTYRAALKEMGVPEAVVDMSALFAAGIMQDDFKITDPALELLLGRKPMTLSRYLQEAFHL